MWGAQTWGAKTWGRSNRIPERGIDFLLLWSVTTLKNPRVNKAKSIIAISGFAGFVTRSVGCSPSNQWGLVWPCS